MVTSSKLKKQSCDTMVNSFNKYEPLYIQGRPYHKDKLLLIPPTEVTYKLIIDDLMVGDKPHIFATSRCPAEPWVFNSGILNTNPPIQLQKI